MLTPEYIASIFEQHPEWSPTTGLYHEKPNHYCAIGAVLKHHGLLAHFPDISMVLGDDVGTFIVGITQGWDERLPMESDYARKNFLLGMLVGYRARALVESQRKT